MEYSKEKKPPTNEVNQYINNVDSYLKMIYEGKKSIQDILPIINDTNILTFIESKNISEKKFLDNLLIFLKRELKKAQYYIKGKIMSSRTNAEFFYNKLLCNINSLKMKESNKNFIEIIGNFLFNKSGINHFFEDTNGKDNSLINNYLIIELNSFLETHTSLNNNQMCDFIKKYHILFCTDNEFDYLCLQFFLIVNCFLCLYNKFNSYNEFVLNFYYMYYKYMKKENINVFKEEIISKIDPFNYQDFSFEKNITEKNFIPSLLFNLESLAENTKRFKLSIDETLYNNKELLNLFKLKEIDRKKLEKFFNFPKLKNNYLKYYLNKDKDFNISIDQLDCKEGELNVFNSFFLISYGLIEKIEPDSLQIFNDDNKANPLLKKYATILLENINEFIDCVKKGVNRPDNQEKFGSGKIFETFYVFYTNMDNQKYKVENLKYDLDDSLTQVNKFSNKIDTLNIKLSQNDANTNFTRISSESKKKLSEEQVYYENVNGYTFEDNCRRYIISHLDGLISENPEKIKLIEMFKILLGLNFFIPYVNENYCLKFKPLKKNMKNINLNNPEYGYQEYDFMFKVLSNQDISMNKKEANKRGLPFFKNMKIKINCQHLPKQEIKIDIKEDIGFVIMKNSLVIVENKLRFPKKKGKFIEYISVMIKKLNFVLKLIRNTSKDLYLYENIQLLLIYDDLIINSNELNEYISKEEIKSILESTAFKESISFTIEIIYVSQVMYYYNISYITDEMNKLKSEVKNLKQTLRDNKVITEN